MPTRRILFWIAGLALAVNMAAQGQEQQPIDDEEAVADQAGTLMQIPPELQDPAFDKYVSLDFLRDASILLDPVQLADAGLQLAEGERVLFRSHRAFDSDTVLRAAVKVAVEKRDEATLARLAAAAKALEKKELLAAVTTAQKLASQPRAIQPGVELAVEEISPEILTSYQATLTLIEDLRIRSDANALDQLAKDLPDEGWPKKLQGQLSAAIATAKREMGKEVHPDLQVLEKLHAGSRGYVFKLWNPFPFTIYVKVYGPSSLGFPDVCKTPTPFGTVAIPYPNLKMPIRMRVPGGSWSSKKTISWKSGNISLPW